jgi:CheY-like chemotaxis protein
VKRCNGAITVDSSPGNGAIFTVYLPVVESTFADNTDSPEALPRGQGRILFVDDEDALVYIGKQMLERLGYEVTARENPLEALEDFRSTPDAYDLVITDMTMPNMTGETLAKEILHIRPETPIIISSGFSYRMDEKKALDMGIKAFIMKPLIMKDVAETVSTVLNRDHDQTSGH